MEVTPRMRRLGSKQRHALGILSGARNGVTMALILDRADLGAWLGGTGGTELLRSAADDRLRMWPVSRRVNKAGSGDDDPTLLDEVAA